MSTSTPPRRYHRLIYKAVLSLAMLLGVLTLCSLLMGCACRPTADPARLEQLIQTHNQTLLDLGIGINCAWSY